jgi:flagellum-specific ATP synthase
MTEVVSKEHLAMAMKIKELIASYSEAEDLINIGAYAKGSNPAVDEAIQFIPQIKEFLKQPFDLKVSFDDSVRAMAAIFQQKQAQPRAGRR